MRTTRIIAVLLLSLSCFIPSQARCDEASAAYFPLKEGMRWEYRVTSASAKTQKLIIINLAPQEIKGTKVTPRRQEMGGATLFEFMKQDDTGIYRYAEQVGDKGPPSMVTPMECHLKFPIAMGDSWHMTTKVGTNTVNLSLTVESVSDEVKVPAGTFKDCVTVKQVSDPGAGASVMGYEWYAPQVGVVKSMVTIKQSTATGATTDTRTYELTVFKP